MTAPSALEVSALEASGVRRSFGAVQAVREAILRVDRGTVTALIGPNGCGKTTLMLMLAGLLQPDAGTIAVEGVTFAHGGCDVRSRIGWMPDVLGTWDSLTCEETLTTFARAYGFSTPDSRDRVDNLLRPVRVPYRKLSAGSRVA